jgi:hypothetical protein
MIQIPPSQKKTARRQWRHRLLPRVQFGQHGGRVEPGEERYTRYFGSERVEFS